MYTVTSHDTGSYTVLLEWEKPDDGGGLKISNYTTTLRVAHSVHTHVETSNNLYLTLLYNQRYSIQIVAANCAGYGQPVYIPKVSEGNNYYRAILKRGKKIILLQLTVVCQIF